MVKDDNYTNVILEEIRSQMQAVLEIVGENQKMVNKIPKMEDGINELRPDVKIIKEAVKQTNLEIKLHDRRITALESKLS